MRYNIFINTLLVLLTTRQLLCSWAFSHRLRPYRKSSSSSFLLARNHVEVQVFDNAFDPSACEMLHDLAVEHYERTNDGSSIFTRPPNNERPLTPIEHAIDSALTEMGDETKRVEYWSRDEFMNINAHADIDEAMLEDEGLVRCPLVGHVLYLIVKDGIRGPTCVFPDEQDGWGLNDDQQNNKKMVVVPAVEGRILRFPGNAMHAVPNPVNRWMLSKKEVTTLRQEEMECDEDDCDYDDDEIERSVLLFNTWPDSEPGPRGVNGDIATGALPEGIELCKEDAESFLKSQEAQILAEWEEEFGANGEKVRCNPFSVWNFVDVEKTSDTPTDDDNDDMGRVSVSLMGAETRRKYSQPNAELKGPRTAIENALKEDARVSSFDLALEVSL